MTSTVIAMPGERAEVEALYAECGYGGGVKEADTTVVAKVNGRLVGAVRLCAEGGITILRGMQVHPAYQRQRIGSQLLSACIPLLDRGMAFCLPYKHLVQFYRAAGFSVVEQSILPQFLGARLATYLAKGQDVLAMQRLVPNPSIEWTRPSELGHAAQIER